MNIAINVKRFFKAFLRILNSLYRYYEPEKLVLYENLFLLYLYLNIYVIFLK